MAENTSAEEQTLEKPHSRIKGWAALFLWMFLIWAFIFYIGPLVRDSIPVMKKLSEVARERDIDTTAFFYSENKESYEAESYLRETLDLAKPKGYGFSGFFFLGIVCCIAILVIGYRFLPNGTNPGPREED